MGTDGAARITFVGDIMCEKPLQRAWNKGGDAVFDRVFSRTGALFAASDYVVGNLETVFAGPARGYTRELYRFNTPDGFARAIAKGGIHLLTTATNHCLDGGVEGLDRTLAVLDRCGLAHTGTFRSPAEPRFLVRRIGGLRVAFLNYTYGVNVHETGIVLPPQDLYRLNLLKPPTLRLQRYVGTPAGTFRRRVSSGLRRFTSDETRVRLKRLLRMPYYAVRVDDIDEGEPYRAYLPALLADLTEEADRLPDAELVIANLLIEYIGYPAFISVIRKVNPEYVSCVIQINTDEKNWVSDSPWLHAFDGLDRVHHQMEEGALTAAMKEAGYTGVLRAEEALPNGKALVRLDYRRTGKGKL